MPRDFPEFLCNLFALFLVRTPYLNNSEVCHPCCVGTITQRFCVLHLQSNTTIVNLKKLRLRSEIWFGFRLSGCLRQLLCECGIFQACAGGFRLCGNVIFA